MDNVNQMSSKTPPDVFEALHTLMHQHRALQHRALRDSGQAVTPLESRVLGFFGRHPGATQSELAEHSGRDKAQLARLIKGLRDRGLLLAEADPQDGRQWRLHLSPEGQAIRRAVQQQARQIGQRALAGLNDKEQAQLLDLLLRLSDSLQAAD